MENHEISERTRTLIKKMLTKDYFRRIGWVELFGYRIDEEGEYILEGSINKFSVENNRHSFSINKSMSAVKDPFT